MCDSRHHGYGMSFGFPMMMKSMCCPPFEQSKEAKTKQLEAIKAQLEDFIAHIDKKIESLEKVEDEE